MREYINLIETMDRADAAQIFQKYGVNPDVSFNKLKQAYIGLVRKYHSDNDINTGTGNDQKLGEINSAFDFFKQLDRLNKEKAAKPVDQTGQNDSSDLEFIKQTIANKVGVGAMEYRVVNFDGSEFRGMFTVHGSPEVFKLMASSMIKWNKHAAHRAIFVQEQGSNDLYLVWSDGIDHNPAIHFDAQNGNLLKDIKFIKSLPSHLEEIKNDKQEQPKEKIKWQRVSLDNMHVSMEAIVERAQYCVRTHGVGWAEPALKEHHKNMYNTLISNRLVMDIFDDQKWAISSSTDGMKTYFYFRKKAEAQMFNDRY